MELVYRTLFSLPLLEVYTVKYFEIRNSDYKTRALETDER